eukprot:m51a1_g8291 hypothetical protein (802) ;mRNA; r:148061-161583
MESFAAFVAVIVVMVVAFVLWSAGLAVNPVLNVREVDVIGLAALVGVAAAQASASAPQEQPHEASEQRHQAESIATRAKRARQMLEQPIANADELRLMRRREKELTAAVDRLRPWLHPSAGSAPAVEKGTTEGAAGSHTEQLRKQLHVLSVPALRLGQPGSRPQAEGVQPEFFVARRSRKEARKEKRRERGAGAAEEQEPAAEGSAQQQQSEKPEGGAGVEQKRAEEPQKISEPSVQREQEEEAQQRQENEAPVIPAEKAEEARETREQQPEAPQEEAKEAQQDTTGEAAAEAEVPQAMHERRAALKRALETAEEEPRVEEPPTKRASPKRAPEADILAHMEPPEKAPREEGFERPREKRPASTQTSVATLPRPQPSVLSQASLAAQASQTAVAQAGTPVAPSKPASVLLGAEVARRPMPYMAPSTEKWLGSLAFGSRPAEAPKVEGVVIRRGGEWGLRPQPSTVPQGPAGSKTAPGAPQRSAEVGRPMRGAMAPFGAGHAGREGLRARPWMAPGAQAQGERLSMPVPMQVDPAPAPAKAGGASLWGAGFAQPSPQSEGPEPSRETRATQFAQALGQRTLTPEEDAELMDGIRFCVEVMRVRDPAGVRALEVKRLQLERTEHHTLADLAAVRAQHEQIVYQHVVIMIVLMEGHIALWSRHKNKNIVAVARRDRMFVLYGSHGPWLPFAMSLESVDCPSLLLFNMPASFQVHSEFIKEFLGHTVGSAGDDGFDDLLIGSLSNNYRGRLLIMMGKSCVSPLFLPLKKTALQRVKASAYIVLRLAPVNRNILLATFCLSTALWS